MVTVNLMSVPELRRTRRNATFLIQLTAQECDLLLAHVEPPGAFDDLMHFAVAVGPLVSFEFDHEQMDDFVQLLEQTANSAQNIAAADRLEETLTRVERGLQGTVDPGLHLVRPAAAAVAFTRKQGQYLAFIHLYQRLHRKPPAEADMRAYFKVTPPVVHEMVKTLHRRGFIERTPGTPRSIKLRIPAHAIPELDA